MKETLHIYKRVSSEDRSREQHSLEYQEEYGIKKSQELGMDYEIHDEGYVTGGQDDLTNRPVLNNLLRRVVLDEIKHIFVWERSRISRSEEVNFILRREFRKHGVIVHDQGGKTDLNESTDRLISGIIDQVSVWEKEKINERTREGIRKSFEQGKVGGQVPPYGYTRDENGYLVIDEEEKEIYLTILEWVENGISVGEVSRRLNDMGIPTKFLKGRPNGLKYRDKKTGEIIREKSSNEYWWKPITIKCILKNPVYYGFRNFRGGLIPHNHPIIDENRWNEIQNKLLQRKKYSRDRKGGKQVHFYLLKGFMKCKKCGSNLMGKKSGSHVYYCGKKRGIMRDRPNDPPCSLRSSNLEFLEQFVWDTVVNTLSNSHLRKEEVKSIILGSKGKMDRDRIKSHQNRISTLNRELEDLENQGKRLLRVFTSGKIEEDVFDSENQVIQDNRIQLDQEKKKIQTQLNLVEDPKRWMSWLDEFDKQVEDLVNLTDGHEKRKILEKYVDGIEVDSEDKIHYITIKLTYPIVTDKLVYNNISNKSDGYRIEEGDDSVSLETVIPRKRREKRSNINDNITTYGPFDFTTM